MDDVLIQQYIANTLRRGELYLEIERMRQVLVRIHKNPLETKEAQQTAVGHASKLFKALLAAKEARQNTVLIE